MFFAGPSPEISHFSKDPWFFLVENGMKAKVWALGVSAAIGGVAAPRLTQKTCTFTYVAM